MKHTLQSLSPGRRCARIVIVALLAAFSATLGSAQETAAPAEPPAPPPPTWTDQAELGIVMISGNSESNTWSFKNRLEGKWERQSCLFKLAGIKADSTEETRFAVGSGTNFDVRSIERSTTTAEAYELAGRYDRKFSKKHGWFVEGGWQRNEFAGYKNRYQLTLGVASTWKETERLSWRTDAGLSWTSQHDVVPKAGGSSSWLGLRLGSTLKVKVGKNAEYGNEVIVDQNLDDTADIRLDMTNSLAVSFTKRLALKVSHRLLHDGDPQLEEINLFDPSDLTTPVGTVKNELDDLDMFLTASLVMSF